MPAKIISQSCTEVKIELTVTLTGTWSICAIQQAVNDAGQTGDGLGAWRVSTPMVR
ncbi:MAG: hypothetical protein R3F19_26235 [Verrucomicrobiales bacterium]